MSIAGAIDTGADIARRGRVEIAGCTHPDLMVTQLAADNKIAAIGELTDRLHAHGIVSERLPFMQSVLERENLQSTILADEVALPHARCRSVRKLGLAVGLASEPLEYPSGEERRPIQLICLIAVPADAPDQYLSLMGSLARRLHDPKRRAAAIQAQSAGELYELLTS